MGTIDHRPDTTALAVAQAGLQTAVATLPSGPLDLHEGITDPDGETACARWPQGLRLESTLGQLVRGRCKSTNLCSYCAKLAAVENAEVLWLDALQGHAPSLWVVLTTPSIDLRPSAFYGDRWQLVKALRRRFPSLQWAALVEMTTGYGAGAGGHRRPHWNLFLKGVGEADLAAVRDVIEAVWCPRQKASPEAQSVAYVRDVAGLIRYVALHFQKESQSPPQGWRGHRFLKSRGYLWTDTPTARLDARSSLRLKRELWRAERTGLVGAFAVESAHLAAYEASELAWELVRLVDVPTDWTADGEPASFETLVIPLERAAKRSKPHGARGARPSDTPVSGAAPRSRIGAERRSTRHTA